MLAWDGEQVVGTLRFYPKAIASLAEAGGLCLQQLHPAGSSEQLVERRFPLLEEIEDRTLVVNCLLTGSAAHEENRYRRRGLGSQLVRHLAEWARGRGWRSIEATTHEDLPVLYGITGSAGRRFWEKLGFELALTEVEPEFEQHPGLRRTMREQAAALGLDPESITNRYTMRLELA